MYCCSSKGKNWIVKEKRQRKTVVIFRVSRIGGALPVFRRKWQNSTYYLALECAPPDFNTMLDPDFLVGRCHAIDEVELYSWKESPSFFCHKFLILSQGWKKFCPKKTKFSISGLKTFYPRDRHNLSIQRSRCTSPWHLTRVTTNKLCHNFTSFNHKRLYDNQTVDGATV